MDKETKGGLIVITVILIIGGSLFFGWYTSKDRNRLSDLRVSTIRSYCTTDAEVYNRSPEEEENCQKFLSLTQDKQYMERMELSRRLQLDIMRFLNDH